VTNYAVKCVAKEYEASYQYNVLRVDERTFWVMKREYTLHHKNENEVGFFRYLIPNLLEYGVSRIAAMPTIISFDVWIVAR
jgi:hypothetical protein